MSVLPLPSFYSCKIRYPVYFKGPCLDYSDDHCIDRLDIANFPFLSHKVLWRFILKNGGREA